MMQKCAKDFRNLIHVLVCQMKFFFQIRPGALQNTLHYNALQYTTLQYITIQYTSLHYTTISLQCNTLQYATIQYITLQYTTLYGVSHLTWLFTTPHASINEIKAFHVCACHHTCKNVGKTNTSVAQLSVCPQFLF